MKTKGMRDSPLTDTSPAAVACEGRAGDMPTAEQGTSICNRPSFFFQRCLEKQQQKVPIISSKTECQKLDRAYQNSRK